MPVSPSSETSQDVATMEAVDPDERAVSATETKVEPDISTAKLSLPSDSCLNAAQLDHKPSIKSRMILGCTGFFTVPCQLSQFIMMLYRKFGVYVPFVVLQYGLNQGVGWSIGGMARRVYFSDVLKLDGATSGRFVAAAMLPWSIKPVFGMLSDAVPVFGYHRTSYMVFAGSCGVLAWTALGALPLPGVAVVPFLALMNMSVSMQDVVIDGKTAELSRAAPEHASNLQSLSWGAVAVGGLVACSCSGLLVDALGPRVVFLCLNVCALGVLVPGLLNWMEEQRLPPEQRKIDTKWLRSNARICLLAAYMSIVAVVLAILQITVDKKVARGIVTGVGAVVLALGVFTALRRVSRILAKTAIFIFVRGCLQPGTGEAMFQWLKNYPGGPQFSPTILSWIDCFGSLGLLAGVTIYNKWLSEVPYRRIFLGAQLALIVSGLFDYVLVRRWNLAIGIPDIVMITGDDAFTVTMGWFFAMPTLVLAAKVCPENVESTLFAMLMALANFGGIVSEFLGVSLLEAFGVVDGNFDHLPDVILAKSVCKFLPLALIPILVPDLKPSDPIDLEDEATQADVPSAEAGDDVGKDVGTNHIPSPPNVV